MTQQDESEEMNPELAAVHAEPPIPIRRIHLFGREFRVPQSRMARIIIGVNLVFLGLLGFLPVLGFWMIPLGLLILSIDIAIIRRLRRRMMVYYGGFVNGKRKGTRKTG